MLAENYLIKDKLLKSILNTQKYCNFSTITRFIFIYNKKKATKNNEEEKKKERIALKNFL